MPKKKGGKSKGYVSNGLVNPVSNKLRNSIRRSYENSADRIINQQAAFIAGKNVAVTIENPNKEETNKKFIKVNGKQFFKDNSPKK